MEVIRCTANGVASLKRYALLVRWRDGLRIVRIGSAKIADMVDEA